MENEQGFWNALGSEGNRPGINPEMFSIILDMIGSKMAPDSPFAGVGTMLGKSSLAAKAEASGRKHSADMFQQLLTALTPGDKPGPTSFTATLGRDGKGFDYSLKGMTEGVDSVKMPGVERPGFLDEDTFMKKYGGF